METFHGVCLAGGVSVQADVQHIFGPGGQYSESLVLTMRIVLSY